MNFTAKNVLMDGPHQVKISEFGQAVLLDTDNPDLIQVRWAGPVGGSQSLLVVAAYCVSLHL
jgi:hypothetical protein